MTHPDPSFPAKILLFGEYTVLLGGEALAVPSALFSGHWADGGTAEQQQQLREWAAYLQKTAMDGLIPADMLDMAQFKAALASGRYFASSIPTGYGAGSSGALCAGLLHTFGKAPGDASLTELKKWLGVMESFFHGSSSGFDPLISYVNQPLLVKADGQIQPVADSPAAFKLFLLDTGIPRQTGPLVAQFKSWCADPYFERRCREELGTFNAAAIEAWLMGEASELWPAFHEISWFQWRYLKPLIPAAIHDLWLEGVSGSDFKLKLCGAGGGGFMLGIWNAVEPLPEKIQAFPVYAVGM